LYSCGELHSAKPRIGEVHPQRGEGLPKAAACDAGHHPVGADQLGVPPDPLGDELGVLHVVGLGLDHARAQDLVVGLVDVDGGFGEGEHDGGDVDVAVRSRHRF
jgi:hypothetical protein